MEEIDDDEYTRTLQKLFNEKYITLKKEKNIFIKKTKLKNYLLQKGYEQDLITGLLNTMKNNC